MSESVADKGYRDTTVADVVRIARTSRRSFYEHFDDRDACYLALFDAVNDALMAEVAAAVKPEHPWERQVDQALGAYLDAVAAQPGVRLIVHRNPDAALKGINPFDHGPLHTDLWKTEGLKQALDKYGFDAAFGGARRDEEASRAKERVFSFRAAGHRWEPRRQRPEMWQLLNGRLGKGETVRVFPLSNWTEGDVWRYIALEKLDVVPLYFAAERPVVTRNRQLIVVDDERAERLRQDHAALGVDLRGSDVH